MYIYYTLYVPYYYAHCVCECVFYELIFTHTHNIYIYVCILYTSKYKYIIIVLWPVGLRRRRRRSIITLSDVVISIMTESMSCCREGWRGTRRYGDMRGRGRERRKREIHITRQRKDYKTRCSTCLVIDGSGDGTRNPVMMPAATWLRVNYIITALVIRRRPLAIV